MKEATSVHNGAHTHAYTHNPSLRRESIIKNYLLKSFSVYFFCPSFGVIHRRFVWFFVVDVLMCLCALVYVGKKWNFKNCSFVERPAVLNAVVYWCVFCVFVTHGCCSQTVYDVEWEGKLFVFTVVFSLLSLSFSRSLFGCSSVWCLHRLHACLMKIRTVAYKLAVFRVISCNLPEKDIIIIIWKTQTSPFKSVAYLCTVVPIREKERTGDYNEKKTLLHWLCIFCEFMSVFGIEYLIMFVVVFPLLSLSCNLCLCHFSVVCFFLVCLKIYSSFSITSVELCAFFSVMLSARVYVVLKRKRVPTNVARIVVN